MGKVYFFRLSLANDAGAAFSFPRKAKCATMAFLEAAFGAARICQTGAQHSGFKHVLESQLTEKGPSTARTPS